MAASHASILFTLTQKTWAFVGEPASTPRTPAVEYVSRQTMLLAPMDTGVDWGVEVLGDGEVTCLRQVNLRIFLGTMGRSHLFSVHWKWRTRNSKLIPSYLGNVRKPYWGNSHRNKENETVLVYQLSPGWNCALIPLPPGMRICSVI